MSGTANATTAAAGATTTGRTYYFYDPSVAAAAVLCALYAVNFLISLYRTWRTRAWAWSVMVLGIAMEIVGFGARIESAQNPTNRDEYIVQFCLVVLAPVLMAAVIYLVFGRIVFHVVPAHARNTKLLWVPPRIITPFFVGFDVVALFLQMGGAVIISGTEPTDPDALSKEDKGKKLALIGISVQIAAFGLFTIVAARFQVTSNRFAQDLNSRLVKADGEKTASLEGSTRKFNPNWRTILYVVNFSCLMIMVRSVYRTIEFSQGRGGEMDQHEYFFYVLDALPISLLTITYNFFFPGNYLPFMGWRKPKESRMTLPSLDENGVPLQDQHGSVSNTTTV